MCRKLIHEPKIAINARIVVVGASETVLSFLETLLFKSHLRFGNITMVAPGGFGEAAVPCMQRSHAYSDAARKAVGWANWVDVVPDTVVAIDRETRMLTLANGGTVPYDYLLLGSELEYV
jgi:NADH dehydrogenase FAD-containing subunit